MPPKIITMPPKKKAKTKIKPNEAIIKHFRELCALYKLKKDYGRAYTFDEFAEFAEDEEQYCGGIEITSVKQVQRLIAERPYIQKIGFSIGKSTFAEIDEFLKTGTSKRLEELRVSTQVKKTQTVPLDKRAQAKLLRGKASAIEAEATVEERIHELLEPAKVSANTYLLKVFHEKASAEVMLSEKKRAYLNAGLAIKECEHEITSGEEAMKLKGVGKSSASLIDKVLEEKKKVAEKFFNTAVNGRKLAIDDFSHDVKDIKEAFASLPENTEIGLAEDGTLYVNGKCREYFYARGCPFETEIGGMKYIVDGTADYDGFSDACVGLKFDGTLTNVKNKTKVYSFSFEYKHQGWAGSEYTDLDWEGDFVGDDIEAIAMEVVSDYEFFRHGQR